MCVCVCVCVCVAECFTEKRLHDAGHLENHPRPYFSAQTAFGLYGIEDDHIPFRMLSMAFHMHVTGMILCCLLHTQ